MNKQNFITITFIITGLVITPAIADNVERNRVTQNISINQSVKSSVSMVLFKRGLEQDSANEMVKNLLDDIDELYLAMLIDNLEMQNIVTKEQVFEYLSHTALHKQKLDFTQYDQLIGMVSKIQQKSLDKSTRKKISQIVKINKQLFV